MCARDPGRAAERYAERLRRSATTGGEGPSLREGWRESGRRRFPRRGGKRRGKNGGAAQGKVNVNSAAPSATPAFNSPSRADTDVGGTQREVGAVADTPHRVGRAVETYPLLVQAVLHDDAEPRRAAALQAEDRRVRLLRRDILVAESDFRLGQRRTLAERNIEGTLRGGVVDPREVLQRDATQFDVDFPSHLDLAFLRDRRRRGTAADPDGGRADQRIGLSANPGGVVVRRHRQDAAEGRFALQPVHRPEIQGWRCRIRWLPSGRRQATRRGRPSGPVPVGSRWSCFRKSS